MNSVHESKLIPNKSSLVERPGEIKYTYEFPDNQLYEKWLKSERNSYEWVYKSKSIDSKNPQIFQKQLNLWNLKINLKSGIVEDLQTMSGLWNIYV